MRLLLKKNSFDVLHRIQYEFMNDLFFILFPFAVLFHSGFSFLFCFHVALEYWIVNEEVFVWLFA